MSYYRIYAQCRPCGDVGFTPQQSLRFCRRCKRQTWKLVRRELGRRRLRLFANSR